jgi:hypothetical protein
MRKEFIISMNTLWHMFLYTEKLIRSKKDWGGISDIYLGNIFDLWARDSSPTVSLSTISLSTAS